MQEKLTGPYLTLNFPKNKSEESLIKTKKRLALCDAH